MRATPLYPQAGCTPARLHAWAFGVSAAGDALTAYESSLVHDPKRLRSYDGAAQAALGVGNDSKARDYFSRMVEMADNNSPRPELIRARQYLAAK